VRLALVVPAFRPALARVALVVVIPIVLRESRLAQRDRHRQGDQHFLRPHGFLPEFLCR
jgi:hypothetical protein